MENREILAFAILGALALIGVVIYARWASKKRAFQRRQAGRGKGGVD
jgi:FtsZ-interacting cell division protein ZipA